MEEGRKGFALIGDLIHSSVASVNASGDRETEIESIASGRRGAARAGANRAKTRSP